MWSSSAVHGPLRRPTFSQHGFLPMPTRLQSQPCKYPAAHRSSYLYTLALSRTRHKLEQVQPHPDAPPQALPDVSEEVFRRKRTVGTCFVAGNLTWMCECSPDGRDTVRPQEGKPGEVAGAWYRRGREGLPGGVFYLPLRPEDTEAN